MVVFAGLPLLQLIASCCMRLVVRFAVGRRVLVAMTTRYDRCSPYGVASVKCVGTVQSVVDLQTAGE